MILLTMILKKGLNKKLHFLMENQHTNIIIINVPLGFDRNEFSIVNEETRELNKKLNKLLEKFNNISVECGTIKEILYKIWDPHEEQG
jgi:hypothetical protein